MPILDSPQMKTSTTTHRKRDAEATRARILDAAKRAFSETGYSHTGIRDIARLAGTSSTLLLRYFGSKAGLFEAALREAMPTYSAIRLDKTTYAERAADILLDPASSVRPPAMIALAAGDPEAAEITARVFEETALAPLVEWLGGKDARERAIAICMMGTGFTTYASQLPLDSQSPDETARLRAWYVRTMNAVIEGTPEWRDRLPGEDADGK